MTDVGKILAAAKRQRDSLRICLDGELDAAYRRAATDLEKTAEQGSGSLGSSPMSSVRERLDALRGQMEAATVEVVVEAVGRRRFAELRDLNPPREGNERDALVGFHLEDMAAALLAEGIVSPQLTDEQRDRFLDEVLTEGQYNELANLAFSLNRRGVSTAFLSAS